MFNYIYFYSIPGFSAEIYEQPLDNKLKFCFECPIEIKCILEYHRCNLYRRKSSVTRVLNAELNETICIV